MAGYHTGEKTLAIDGKAMKKTLTATHFVLGNDKPSWGTTATMADPSVEIKAFRRISLLLIVKSASR